MSTGFSPKEQERIAEIRARLEKATPGPWVAEGLPYDGYDDPCIFAPNTPSEYYPDRPQYVAQTVYDMQSTTLRDSIDADTELIAHAPEDLAFLLSLLGVGPDQEQTQ